MEFVGVMFPGGGQDVELHGQIVAGVHFLEHRERRHLGVTKVCFGVGAMHAPGERFFFITIDPDALSFLAEDDGGAGILAHRQHAARGDIGVFQQVQRDEAVIPAGLRIVQNRPQ